MQEENRTLKVLVAEQALLIAQLQQHVQALQEREVKDSHNSHVPPSSDRFLRQPRCLQMEEQIKQALTQVEFLHQDEKGLYVSDSGCM